MNEENSSGLSFSEHRANVLSYALIHTSEGDDHPLMFNLQLREQAY